MRDLKQYDSYLVRLLTFAKAMDIKIVFTEVDGYGAWVPTSKTIKIDDDMSQSDTIGTFLHELGHSLDDLISNSRSKENKIDEAYIAVYNDLCTKMQLSTVVDFEKRAWKLGRDIAKRLKIRLGAWYDLQEKEAIKAYKNTGVK